MISINEQKEIIRKIVYKCYDISRNRNFKSLRVSTFGNETIIACINRKLKVFKNLDPNSEVYKGIHRIAKKALYELKAQTHEYWYLEIISVFCSIPDEVSNKISKRVIEFPEKELRQEVKIINKPKEKNSNSFTVLPIGFTGSKFKNLKESNIREKQELDEMSFDDENNVCIIEDDFNDNIEFDNSIEL